MAKVLRDTNSSLEDKLNKITDENRDHSHDDYEFYDLYKSLCNINTRLGHFESLCKKYEDPIRVKLTVEDAINVASKLNDLDKAIKRLAPFLDRYPKVSNVGYVFLGIVHCVKLSFGRVLANDYLSSCDFYGIYVSLNTGVTTTNIKNELKELIGEIKEKTIDLGFLVFDDDLFVID